MTTKKKSPARRQELNHNDNKDTKVYRIKAIVKSLFESAIKQTTSPSKEDKQEQKI